MMAHLQTLFALVGGIAGIWALYDRFRNHRPNLKAFAPYYWTGRDSQSKAPMLCVFFRIANHSKTSAFLYLETLKFSVYGGVKWVTLERVDFPPDSKMDTDFADSMKVRFGLGEAKVLSRYSESSIAFDKPLCGYLVFHHPNLDLLRDFSKMRLEVHDCHFHRHDLEIDLKDQSRFDPGHQSRSD